MSNAHKLVKYSLKTEAQKTEIEMILDNGDSCRLLFFDPACTTPSKDSTRAVGDKVQHSCWIPACQYPFYRDLLGQSGVTVEVINGEGIAPDQGGMLRLRTPAQSC